MHYGDANVMTAATEPATPIVTTSAESPLEERPSSEWRPATDEVDAGWRPTVSVEIVGQGAGSVPAPLP
jgi:hypothetical protein